jgi:dGTPase
MTVSSRKARFWKGDRGQDQRNTFQRDRDRVLYTSAFRRLAWVTQVVSSEEGEPFHNRLTHTLEVAQIGRRLAEKFRCEQSEMAKKLGDVDPDVVEAAALAHDMGHPPFGHTAEEQLRKCMKGVGVCDGFEGNAQSFRIVTKLAIRHYDIDGLNLSRATLNAILKYPWLWLEHPEKYNKKWGAYTTEREEFEWARRFGPADDHQCAEASVIDLSDDIAYAVHDLEDFYRAGLIPLDRLAIGDDEVDKFAVGASQALAKEGKPGEYEPA